MLLLLGYLLLLIVQVPAGEDDAPAASEEQADDGVHLSLRVSMLEAMNVHFGGSNEGDVWNHVLEVGPALVSAVQRRELVCEPRLDGNLLAWSQDYILQTISCIEQSRELHSCVDLSVDDALGLRGGDLAVGGLIHLVRVVIS